jgi:hypothetical protein
VKYFKTKIKCRSADIAKILRLTVLDSLISAVGTADKMLSRHSLEFCICEINNDTTVYSFLADIQLYNKLDQERPVRDNKFFSDITSKLQNNSSKL